MAIAIASGDPFDAAAIGVVLAINAALGFFTDLPARRAIESLATLQVARATAMRDGHALDLDAWRLVPGDLVLLEAGQAVPADARLLYAAGLRTNEAPLTGESLPVDKDPAVRLVAETPVADRQTMVYQGTTVVAGRARALVVSTGSRTEVGRIGALASAVPERRTPLERRLDTLGRRLAVAALGVAGVVALQAWWHGAPLRSVIAGAIALAVAAVPEGLPAVVTVCMAVGVRRMARRRALVRHLPVVESLGSATVICSDKTGTLTSGEMTATSLTLADGRDLGITGTGYTAQGTFQEGGRVIDPAGDPVLVMLLETAALASRGEPPQADDGTLPSGDPTDLALLVAARKAGIERSALLAVYPEVDEVPFSSETMYMATVHHADSGRRVCVKGAPRPVLDRCSRTRAAGSEVALDATQRDRLLRQADALAARGLRVLAVAGGVTDPGAGDPTQNLLYLGCVGLTDPPAPGVQETITAIRSAGIRTIMITGDHRDTAQAVAAQLGLLQPGDGVLEGPEVTALAPETLAARLERVGAFGRITPEDKLRIVQAYQARGEIVAMLGDGVNDAAALRQADVGVAMGRRGSDVAREAADVVLQDDRFQTVAAAIEEGRVMFDNIRKFAFYLFSCNLAEVLVILGAGIAGWLLPLRPLQILWLNLVTDTLPALALALEPAEPDVMRRPPRAPTSAILSGVLFRNALLYAVGIALCTLAALGWGALRRPDDPASAVTMAFTTLALAQILHLGNARSAGPVATVRRALANRHAVAAAVMAMLLQVAAVEWAPLAQVLGTRALPWRDWAVVGGLALVPAIVGQLAKGLLTRR